MKEKRRVELKEKGWSENEIIKAESILEKEKEHDVHFSKIVFWSALIVIIFANLIVSLILIPFLIVLRETILYAIIIILAGTIGFLYNFLITDIGHLEKKHHLAAGIIIPIIALANILVMVLVSNRFITEIEINNPPHNPWIVAIVFAISFVIPYIVDKLRIHFQERKKHLIVN
jgi:hypothetical protein